MDGQEATTGRRGRVGAEIFEQVEQLVGGEGITRTQAFERISEQTGRRSGTVAANYYRVARQRGADLAPRRRRAGGGRRRGATGGGDVAAAVTRAQAAVDELSQLVRQQDKELTQLRDRAEQFEKFRRWMDRNVK